MHELSVTESILRICVEHAEKENASRVTDVYITLGRLSSIVDDSVQFYWELIAENSICAAAQLHFERIPAKILCLDCSNEYELDRDLEPCPKCHSARIKVISGDQFYVDSIAIEKGEKQ
ncbi:MAG TPA: hydrogenase maturation nickel metallochaperone HypA [Longilinea sp.]|nr:hydrogenase maturation nickel metallochaperone HypA [Longilinea sp.]